MRNARRRLGRPSVRKPLRAAHMTGRRYQDNARPIPLEAIAEPCCFIMGVLASAGVTISTGCSPLSRAGVSTQRPSLHVMDSSGSHRFGAAPRTPTLELYRAALTRPPYKRRRRQGSGATLPVHVERSDPPPNNTTAAAGERCSTESGYRAFPVRRGERRKRCAAKSG